MVDTLSDMQLTVMLSWLLEKQHENQTGFKRSQWYVLWKEFSLIFKVLLKLELWCGLKYLNKYNPYCRKWDIAYQILLVSKCNYFQTLL